MPLAVAYDTTSFVLNRAGEYRYAKGLAGALERRDDVALTPLVPARRPPNGTAQRIAMQAAIQGAWYPLALPRLARRAGAELVHFPRALVPPTPGLRVPTVLTIHDVIVLRAPELFSREIAANFRLLVPRAARRVTRVVTSTDYSRSEIIELLRVPPGRVIKTQCGMDERFRPAPASPETLARFGIDRPYVACLGTLEPRKNLAAAVRAFARFAERSGTDHALVIVGGAGWRNDAFEATLREVPAPVIRTGFVDDDELIGLLSSAECLLYPSLYEGIGLPPLEAMACGTPVITSNRSSLPEVAGDAALLVDPEDDDAIADALGRLLGSQELREELRGRGIERARPYTWEACARDMVGVYEEALAA